MNLAQRPEPPEAEPTSAWLRTETLAQSLILLVGLTVAQRLVGFLRGVLFCRWLDPESLGEWDLSFGFLMLAAPVAVFGIPGSFGRYLEHFRQRGQLRTFLQRTIGAALGLGIVGVGLVALFPGPVSRLVYGRDDLGRLAAALAATLATVIVYNFLVSLFTALRMFRLASSLQFVQSLVFALVALVLFALGQATTLSVVLAYGAGCLVAMLGPLRHLAGMWRELPPVPQPMPRAEFWARLLPFALWMWTVNWLINLFELVDRYLIVHASGLPADTALEVVGQYHSARVVPLVIYSVASMMAATLTPHLSHDWEAGHQALVQTRLRLMLKLHAWGLTAAGCGVLLISDPLFNVALGGKYAAGLAVLPVTLMFSIWAGLGEIAMNYLWLREKAHLGSVALLAGLLLNIAFNLMWVPSLGLAGAVAATALAKGAVMLAILYFSHRLGLVLDRATLAMTLLPAALCGGLWAAAAALAVTAALLATQPRWISPAERSLLAELVHRPWEKWRRWRSASQPAAGA